MSKTIQKILLRHGQIHQSSLRRFSTTPLVRDHHDALQATTQNADRVSDGSAQSSSTSAEVSRDMSAIAESSRSASSDTNRPESQSKEDEDKQFAEIFATLNENWPKDPTGFESSKQSPTSRKPKGNPRIPPRPESIASRLTFDGYSTPSPRHKGVHSRFRRSAGQTPKEAETFNEILAGIFADLNHPSNSHSPTSGSGPANASARRAIGRSMRSGFGLKDPYMTTQSGSGNLNFGMGNPNNNTTLKNNAKNLRKWLGETEETEENLQFLEELELLKEEMEVISSDIELIEWAKSRVFKPLSEIPTSTISTATSNSANPSNANTDANANASPIQTENTMQAPSMTLSATPTPTPMISYPATYPKILAHLLRTLRVNYNSPHLVLSLFQHAKTASLESYLSGCLTEVYNEVLTVRWESFRDLIGVEEGIREMEIMGVGWDQTTSKLISKIVEEVSKDLLSSDGQPNSPVNISSILAAATQGNMGFGLGVGVGMGNEGFGSLANITQTSKQGYIFNNYGENVLIRLKRLDERVSKDVKKQEKYYEMLQKRKRQLREQRERKAARERRENEKVMGGSEHGKQQLGWIGEPKEGERAFI
ncbi:uncharacterized protein I303_105150 [Kwoniella dejecticola CBS 10117]|uniref:Mtf2-like C-terminal domain-containing protein n=1 Tax=Kwoniella dejecticola CBS 10117 TaxID=1296121 RepID=A0A1A6A3B1_9TREE|nr:uncharacterized protein I303_05404 [Kwoniella dejecticola CBS 10117]OBR84545.1 hypothetical protein I303_05404 [Kwoniella dejecticola CBS 10117]